MRAVDIIRNVLDLLDRAEKEQEPSIEVEIENQSQEDSRFKQIVAMLNNPSRGSLSNTPNEIVADVDSVTVNAGGGVNGSKHPDDIRVKDPRGYE